MTELKPCPFCGAPVGIVFAGSLNESRIECISCGGQVRCAISKEMNLGAVIDYLMNTWNERVKE